jgi:hypothetical protein
MLDAFKVSILVKVPSEASAVLGILNRDFAKSEAAAKRLHGVMSSLKTAGALGLAAGSLAYGLDKALKPAMEYQNQVSTVSVQLNNQLDTTKAIAAAWQTSKDVLTSMPAENLKVFGETAFAFGNVDSAVKALPQFMKMSAILEAFTGKEGVDQAVDAAKLQELRANMGSEDGFGKALNAMTKTVEATRGKVSPEDYYAFAKMASPYLMKFSDQFLYNEAPTMMQDMNPSKAGTAVTTLEQLLVGGRMTKAQFALFKRGGLIDADASYKTDSMGKVQLDKRKIHGLDEAQSDPYRYTLGYIVPMLDKLSQGDKSLWPTLISQLFPIRTEARAITDFINNSQRIAKGHLEKFASTTRPQ